ncbi:MAG: hypothetical protein LH609_15095, partial [Rudanella sp.]|nr:hypothetical protein [Rudanella sp.]
PLSLIDLDPTVQVAVEIPLRPNWSIQQEVGYGWPSLGLFSYQKLADRAKTTFRARTQIRYYFGPNLTRRGLQTNVPTGFYVAGELLFKEMMHKSDREIPSPNGVTVWPNLPKRETARIQRNVYALHANLGYQGVPSRKHPNFLVDVYVGVGFRIVSVRQTSGPSVIYSNGTVGEALRFTRFVPFDGTLRKPSMTAGVKIGWMLKSTRKAKKK